MSPITAQASQAEGPTLFTAMTDRANALVWRMPAPRRLRVLLSQLVYRNPPIPRKRALEALAGLGFEPWNHDSAPGPIGEVHVSSAQTFRDCALRVVELHAADLSEIDAVRGRIGTMPVSCLSADHQLHAQRQMGRTWTPRRRSNQRRNLAAVTGALNGDADGP